MYCLVREQAFLHEVTHQVTDLHGDGRDVVHGPWLPRECQAALTPWHRAGWIDLIADADPPLLLSDATWRAGATRKDSYLVLAAVDASALLREPSRWSAHAADGHVMLCLSDEGDRHDYPEWLALADQGGSAV